MDQPVVASAELPEARQDNARVAAALCGEDDGPQPSAGNEADRPVHGAQRDKASQPPPAPVSESFHEGRFGITGEGRRSARDDEWTGNAEDTGTRMGDLQTPRMRAIGDGLGSAHS